jgi:ATP-dependent exoDNAse (exonuclease V) beta subunit
MDLKNQHNLTGEDAQLAESLILEMLKSPLFSERLAHADMLFRELPFSVMLDNVLYEGRMDLVFMENAQPVIVDFKTNVGSSEDLIEKYKPQAEIYARALEHIIGCEVREVILYHVRQNRALIVTRPAAI